LKRREVLIGGAAALAASLFAPLRRGVATAAVSTAAKYPRIGGIWENPGDFAAAAAVGQSLDLVIFHFGTARQAAAVKAAAQSAGRTVKTACYVFPTHLLEDGSQPWSGALKSAAEESWYLHNPQTSLNAADRVRDKNPLAVLDITNTAYQRWIGPQIVSAIRNSAPRGGIDGIYHDGASLTGNLGYHDRAWSHRPSGPPSTPGTQAALWPAWMRAFLDALKGPLTAAGMGYLIVNSTTPGRFTDGDWIDDTPFIAHSDAGFNEFFCSSYLEPHNAQIDQRNWPWWTQRLQASMAANKDYICMGGVKDWHDPGDRWLTYTLASFLLYTNGVNGYFMWQPNGVPADALSYLQSIQATIGTPAQSALANGDGTYQRQFTNKLVLVNPTQETRRGLRPYTAGIG
jgi:hypothetical protein